MNGILTIDNEMETLVDAFSQDDEAALMKLSGQKSESENTGLPRLNINYDTETEDGLTLPRGQWRMYYDGQNIYSPEVIIRPILRTYEWSVWDQEAGTFAAKSVQKPSISGDFPDNLGGNKCGRLSKQEEEKLAQDDPILLNSRSVACNQVIYGTITGEFKSADGKKVVVSDDPFVSYFKKSGFRPIREFIDGLTKQKKIMQKCRINLKTARKKNGGVTYWVPVPTLRDNVEITESDKQLMSMFAQSVKSHNENIMAQYRENSKLVGSQDDSDLASDFNVNAA